MSKAAELANLIGNINMNGGGVNRNVIINGAMNVAQRGTSTTGLGADGTAYNTVDRFQHTASLTAGRFTQTQDSSAPSGFANSLKLLVQKKLSEGFNENQIYEYLKERYGEWILFDPEFNKKTYFLWLMPILMFLIGGLLIFKLFIIRKN